MTDDQNKAQELIHQIKNSPGIEHSFDIHLVKLTGSIEAAIVYKFFKFWLHTNYLNGKNYRDGKYWTYNTRESIANQFKTYLTFKQVRTAIDKLVKRGILVKGNYNKFGADRTIWYSLADESMYLSPEEIKSTGPNGPMLHRPERAEVAPAQTGRAIPVTIPYPIPVDSPPTPPSGGPSAFAGKRNARRHGTRANGENPRALGSNARSENRNPRALRHAEALTWAESFVQTFEGKAKQLGVDIIIQNNKLYCNKYGSDLSNNWDLDNLSEKTQAEALTTLSLMGVEMT